MAARLHTDGLPVLAASDLDAHRVWEVATSTGCFHVPGDVDSARMRGLLLDAARDLHAEPESLKRTLAMNAGRRGYVDHSSASGSLTRGQSRYAVFSAIAPPTEIVDEPSYAALFRGSNQWPDWIPGWQARVTEGWRHFGELARRVLRALAAGDAALDDASGTAFAEPMVTLRLLGYKPDLARDLAFPQHTDFGGVTILLHDRVDGLEIRSGTGSWLPVHPLEGSALCMFGEMMQVLTNGRVLAPPHRVVGGPRGGGHCAVVFFDPHPDAVIQPASSLCEEEGPRYDAVKYGAHLLRRTLFDQLMRRPDRVEQS